MSAAVAYPGQCSSWAVTRDANNKDPGITLMCRSEVLKVSTYLPTLHVRPFVLFLAAQAK